MCGSKLTLSTTCLHVAYQFYAGLNETHAFNLDPPIPVLEMTGGQCLMSVHLSVQRTMT